MCILCVISRWSRRIVAMLPWLVIPFIITWAFSQLLPPDYRLEVTSTRLACLGVLLGSLGWYELLMPWLSSWRARRNALLRERKLIEAQEAAKWRKEATRRCRNCLTAYKVQTPGGGKFMCTYCGHVSKRPVLEIPAGFASQIPGHGNGLTLLNTKVPPRNDAGCWSRVSDSKGCAWFCESAGRCETCRSWQYISNAFSALGSVFTARKYIWGIFTGKAKYGSDNNQGLEKLNNDLDSSYASRVEKARRKANEKRQARLEKELLEAEERKQREDVARLVEERRRQREEKLHAEKEFEKETTAEPERESKRADENGKHQRKDKSKERAQAQKEQRNTEDGLSSLTTHTHDTCRKHSPVVSSSTKPAETLKLIKISKGLKNQQLSKSSSTTNNLAKTELQIISNDAKRHSRTCIEKQGTVSARKAHTGVDLPPTKFSGNHLASRNVGPPESVWKKAPWANAWTKQTKDHDSSAQVALDIGKDKIHKENADICPKLFNNVVVGSKQTLSPIGVSVPQQPIAPPANHPTLLHQLFSSPTIFPPLDLPQNKSKEVKKAEIKSSYQPACNFFEPSPCLGFQSANPLPGLCPPASPLSSYVMSTDGETNDLKASDINYGPVSPISITNPDAKSFDQSSTSPTSNCSKLSQLDLNYEKDGILSWDFSSLPNLGITDVKQPTEYGTPELQLNDKKLNEQFEYEDNLCPLQLTHLSTVQSLFDSEIILPESLSLSPAKEGIRENIVSAPQVLDRISIWSDISTYNTAARIWDDVDSNQKVPPEFVDCITQEIMQDPVITADGHSYERSAIEKWLMHHDTSPKTGEVLPPPPGGVGVDKTLRPNHILRGQIIDYKEKLAKMQLTEVSWSNTSKDDNFVPKLGSLSVLSF